MPIELYQSRLYLTLEKTKITDSHKSTLQTNSICERFHKTIPSEFYQVTFRENLYTSLNQLQLDVDRWLEEYNHEQTHQGKICNGRTPIQTLNGADAKELWKQKN